ncbi:hypothetical protein D3C79_608010 [compost metagenome]
MGRLVEVVRGLDGQAATGHQLAHQVRVQLGMVGQPLQGGVGEDHIDALFGAPAADITHFERQLRQALAGGGDHVCRAVQAGDLRLGVTAGKHLRGVARAAAKVDSAGYRLVGQRRHQVAHRARAFVLEGAVLRG